MTVKSSPGMIRRFSGRRGRQRLIDAMSVQLSVAGDRSLGREFSNAGKLVDLKPGGRIAIQGDANNDLFFIISGRVRIVINNREIATRQAGGHVGEMALLDPTARRSATVEAVEPTLVLRVSESRVTRVAKRYPEFWRRVAVELAARLRERSKFIPEPHANPMIFVGSSSEALPEASWISQSLNRRRAVSRLWAENVFHLSRTATEDLVLIAAQSDFGVLILTPDDMTTSRGKKKASPRDNAVFELGLFLGALGRERAFIVTPRGADMKLPTDLLGLTQLQYKTGAKKTLGRRLRPASRAIWKRIQELGPK